MNKNIKIGVSLLSSNLAEVQNECDRIIEGGADFLHFDIMDGHFVDNLTSVSYTHLRAHETDS